MKTLGTIGLSFIAGILGAALVVNGTIPISRTPQGNNSITDSVNNNTQSTQLASAHETTIVETVQKVSPAVVSIVISKDIPKIEQYFEDAPSSPFGSLFDPFGQFNVRIPRLRQNGTERQDIGGGSGFLVTADGLIVTNRHVVTDTAAQYTVFLQDGTKFEATVLDRDTVNDIAILKIEANDLPFLTFGNSAELQPGQTVIAIGNALAEFRNSVSVGVISGLSRSIIAGDGQGQTEQLEEVIQTDAAINPGNSGGPLLNTSGEVIGVNVAVAQGTENIGFALPANAVTDIVQTVRDHGRIIHPYLGVRYAPITPVVKERNNLPVETGVVLIRGEQPTDLAVIPGSPAAKAGLVEGDIITKVDGIVLDNTHSLASIIRQKKVGETVTLTVIKNGEDQHEQTVPVTLQEAPSTAGDQ